MTTKPFGQQRPAVKRSGPIQSPLGLTSTVSIRGWGKVVPPELDGWEAQQERMHPGIEFERRRYDLNDPESGWQVVVDG